MVTLNKKANHTEVIPTNCQIFNPFDKLIIHLIKVLNPYIFLRYFLI